MTIVDRKIRVLGKAPFTYAQDYQIEFFRDVGAFVLLGEPGVGKSTLMKAEAKNSNGRYFHIKDFMELEFTEDLEKVTFFIDALDETRILDGRGDTLRSFCRQIEKFKKPKFRIACRIADWYGVSDSDDLKNVSPDNNLILLQISPLDEVDIIKLLIENHSIQNPQEFIRKASENGLYELLRNPQTLQLLADAIREENWPGSRDEVFKFACSKLVLEKNKNHRDNKRISGATEEELLHAAGQLNTLLLLSGTMGIALDEDNQTDNFPVLDGLIPDNKKLAHQALNSRLFRFEGDDDQHVIPIHRTVSEYLSANWLADKIHNGLPHNRILNLLLSSDSTIINNLKGVAAWLSLFCISTRKELIGADPLSIIQYGDIKSFSIDDKRYILKKLEEKIRAYPGIIGEINFNYQFGIMADEGLLPELKNILNSLNYDDVTQSLIYCVIMILSHGTFIPKLEPLIYSVVENQNRWPLIRQAALQLWLNLALPSKQLKFLNHLKQYLDSECELVGILLSALYPSKISAEQLFEYFDNKAFPDMIGGSYRQFWIYDLLQNAPIEDLPILIKHFLANKNFLYQQNSFNDEFSQVAGNLLIKAIESYGECISDEQLFNWLELGIDNSGLAKLNNDNKQKLSEWMTKHPERYKSILLLCYQQNVDNLLPHQYFMLIQRLNNISPPNDIAMWHLDQVNKTKNKEIATQHLKHAIQSLFSEGRYHDLTLEKIEKWRNKNPGWDDTIANFLSCKIPELYLDIKLNRKDNKEKELLIKVERNTRLLNYFEQIKLGDAPPSIMYELALLWKNYLQGGEGASVEERFVNYCEKGREIFEIAEDGFISCLRRQDLPTIEEIIQLFIKNKEYRVALPCLIGMELIWKKGKENILHLSDDMLKKMLAFSLTCSYEAMPEWVAHLAKEKPEVVSEVLTVYLSSSFQAKKKVISGTYELLNNNAFQSVSQLIVIDVLREFPINAIKENLPYLNNLLKAALTYNLDGLKEILDRKIKMKSMSATQKVYWYACSALVNPTKYQNQLWEYLKKSEARVIEFSNFFGDGFGVLINEENMQPCFIGKLIENLTPYADLNSLSSGIVTETSRLGTLVRALINLLGKIPTKHAQEEINRLIESNFYMKLKYYLERARYENKILQREKNYRYPTIHELSNILANKEPANLSDLNALILDTIDNYSKILKTDNADLYKHYWNINKSKKLKEPRDENNCRDILLNYMRIKLGSFGIDLQPESDCVDDKRTDICVSFKNKYRIPIEIKRQQNPELWQGLNDQLIKQYIQAKETMGFGIYLIFWFGERFLTKTFDGLKKPKSPLELKVRLENEVMRLNEPNVSIRVLDVSID